MRLGTRCQGLVIMGKELISDWWPVEELAIRKE